MKKTVPFMLMLMLVYVALLVSCASSANLMPGAGEVFDDAPTPRFAAVTVHDPSVFPASDDEFYAIGSHLAAARTTDFIQWKQVTLDWSGKRNQFFPEDNPNPAVQKMQDQIKDVMRGSEHDLGMYASDIHLMPNGKFYHYYSMTSSWCSSAIGLAIADKIEGPYITQGLIVRSEKAANGSLSPDGTRAWSVARHPNCIDPQAFFDKDNKNFYLVYGSYSGGIFVYELDPGTGMLKTGSEMNAENDGYGRKLLRNNHASIEGPYIIYSPEADYYYLFVSYGWLSANGGYSMRVFRSRNPDGPYEDATHPGVDLGKDLRYSEHAEYGIKIMGSYKFRRVGGETSLGSTGYLAPGHNSAYYDPSTGRYFLVYHQRFEGRGEYHEVRVSEMFVNEDGWLIAAPFRYDGGTVRSFSRSSIPGTWKLLNHGKVINTEPILSNAYQFLDDGTLTGPKGSSGTWVLGDDGKTAHITVDGVLYKGVFLRCYDENNKGWVQAFTALSGDGVALWGAGVALKK